MRILCDEPASEADKEVRQQDFRGQTGTSRRQRTRNMPPILQECVITSDYVVDDEGELIHYAFYADTVLFSVTEEMKDSKWIHAMNEELKSNEVNNTWSLVESP